MFVATVQLRSTLSCCWGRTGYLAIVRCRNSEDKQLEVDIEAVSLVEARTVLIAQLVVVRTWHRTRLRVQPYQQTDVSVARNSGN